MPTTTISSAVSGVCASPDHLLETLLADCRASLAQCNEQLVRKAFYFCVEAHRESLRASGEPYYTHPVEVARIVAREIALDDISVAAALLHDVLEDSEFTYQDLQAEFGSTIADIVESVTKIADLVESRTITEAETYRKLLLSLIRDVRAILVKLADRLHNMRTIGALPPERQARIARETLDIYVPFAHRLGLANLKWELEDLAFKVLNPESYAAIAKALQETRAEREAYIRRVIAPIEEHLHAHGLQFEITGRPKNLYSIHYKMVTRGKPLEEIYDLFAIRIILDTDDSSECYFAYGLITQLFTPIPERFKDFIAVPKKNGYRSLHTTIIGPEGRPVEIQIRTRAMHEVAERGVAAHFRYKAEQGALPAWKDDPELEEWIQWVRELFEKRSREEAAAELLESFRLNLYQDEIYVFTPKGELKRLPKGATPLDFAFAIHTEIGHHCIGAKVNGRIVPLDYRLQTGDQVEILTSKHQAPSRDWEQIVVTHKAKSYIRRYLNEQKRLKQQEGQQALEKRLRKARITVREEDLERVAHLLKYENRAALYYAIGTGAVAPELVVTLLQQRHRDGSMAEESAKPSPAEQATELAQHSSTGIELLGTPTGNTPLLYSYARCCNPIPGDDIVGVITLGSGIRVHRRSCRNVQEFLASNHPRLVQVRWGNVGDEEFLTALRITGDDRPGMLHDITKAIVACDRTNIRSVNIDSYGGIFEGIFTLYVRNTEHLERLIEKLRRIRGVRTVTRPDSF
ncbi:MAG: bifunctional (p)ppGpp synthetase/guanosine-3',5'-bis(diphosphate) 3'-pyrophosphohydrolase [Candidatus Kapabacteria bacterium]|nr:bifunctional (p)ppGpp synthetase/guanosine-3',5'-bis(diphosphate) 3'-pyrophosphohydrolase [Candidatus Kapabacteria bacterium]MDW8012083.1 bifunctional (p)ppGpp synthetase/guanosine-3',5'-bis(diphosphate) 3'-pyrophosphohydrolase [Bacteroidota bacterium]